MKKVIYGMSMILLTVGCTQPISLPQCVNYYKDKPIELKKCIDANINAHLSPIGKNFEGGTIVNKNESIPSTTSGTVEHQDGSATGGDQDTSGTVEHQDGSATGGDQDTSGTVEHQDGSATGGDQDTSGTVEHQDGSATGGDQDTSGTVEHQDASGTVAEQERKIISDINTMCNSLEQNYVKFNTSSAESRVRNKAKKAYQACKKEQKELKQGLK